MGRILAVGNATLDIINVVEEYPKEDQEVRALAQQYRRGGNACNTLTVLRQLGHDCSWAGTLADEPDAAIIRADLDAQQIDCSAVRTVEHGKVPTSYIALSRHNGSRTIVHYRDLPEYAFDDFSRIDLGRFDWIHFEARNITELERMLQHARQSRPELPISLEVEKPRQKIEALFSHADLLLFSKDYAQYCGYHDAESFLQRLHRQEDNTVATCSWGEMGAAAINSQGELFHSPAFIPPQVIDTLGAGDTFNAGVIDQLLRKQTLETALIEASRLAGRKCGIHGLHNILD